MSSAQIVRSAVVIDIDPAAESEAAAARRARFGSLPGRVRPEDTVEERAAAPDPDRDAYNADEWLVRYAL